MKTFFDLVLGTLLIVAKTFLHGLVSILGLVALCALFVIAGICAWRRRYRQPASPPETPEPVSIDR